MALTVVVLLTGMAPLYGVEEVVGVLPSVVKKIVAPVVASERVTDCVVLYVPGAGLKPGVAAAVWMVYVPLATALVLKPAAVAMALIVVVLLTGMAPLYGVEEV